MAVICAWCGKPLKATLYFCPVCRVHYGWDCTNNGKCRRCSTLVLRMS